MATYQYQALNPGGREEKGVLEADSARQVRQILRERGLTPLDVEESRERARKAEQSFFHRLISPALSPRELALVTRQLATLVESSLPVEEALLAVSRQSEKAAIGHMLLDVRSKVLEGYSLANSLAEYPRAFPELYRATVAAGEASGHLELILNRLADFTEEHHASRSRIQQAMIYPILLMGMTLLILTGMLVYVVPDIVKVFEDTNQALPFLTILIINVSRFVTDYGLVIFLLMIGGIWGVHRLLQKPRLRLSWDKRLLQMPLFGRLARGTGAASFSSTLAILTASGVPLVEAMGIAEQVIDNKWLQQCVAEARVRVREGSSLNRALQQSGYFPPMMLHMIASGESSGELDKMLSKVSAYLQQDREMYLGVILSLMGPLMLLFMGGAVFTIVMAILLPIMNLNQLVV